jgi:hypothetical protein
MLTNCKNRPWDDRWHSTGNRNEDSPNSAKPGPHYTHQVSRNRRPIQRMSLRPMASSSTSYPDNSHKSCCHKLHIFRIVDPVNVSSSSTYRLSSFICKLGRESYIITENFDATGKSIGVCAKFTVRTPLFVHPTIVQTDEIVSSIQISLGDHQCRLFKK